MNHRLRRLRRLSAGDEPIRRLRTAKQVRHWLAAQAAPIDTGALAVSTALPAGVADFSAYRRTKQPTAYLVHTSQSPTMTGNMPG